MSDNPDIKISRKSGSKASRGSRKGHKSREGSLQDDMPSTIEEIIPSSSPESPPKTIKYSMGEILGKGAAAVVLKAKNLETGELVAVKKIYKGGMRQDRLKTFLQAVETEFALMKELHHPNIVEMKGRVEDDWNIYIILEYVNGGSLATYLSKYGTFSPEIAAAQLKQVLQGLSYLHQHGIVHRDIKAANLLISKSGVVKLADFGVSAKLENTEKRYSVVGTPYWMAPEVISMSGHTGKSDIWSLGCTLIELVTGHPPYWELDPMRAVFCIAQDEMPPIPKTITGDLYRFLHQCFIKDPEKRPSADELLQHPFILNCKLPSLTPSGKMDAKHLKKTIKAYHGISTGDSSSPNNPPTNQHSSESSLNSNQQQSNANTASDGNNTNHPDVRIDMSSSNTSQNQQNRARTEALHTLEQNVARAEVLHTIEQDDSTHDPVPTIHDSSDEQTKLLKGNNNIIYVPASLDGETPCCNIL